MDVSKYIDLKASSNVQLSKIGESFAMVVNKYNPDTGEKVAPIVEAIDKKQVMELRDNLIKHLAQLDEVLKDMDILTTVVKEPVK